MRKNSLLRDNWKDYFNFPKRLRKGIYILFLIILSEIAFLLYMHYRPSSKRPVDTSQFQKEINAFYSSMKKDSTTEETNFVELENNVDSKENTIEKAERKSPELFSFNPNSLPEEDWKRLGFSDKQIHVIKNYESKGGKFRTKDDVKKMYCINQKEFDLIEPYIVIPPQQTKDTSSHNPSYKKYERPIIIVDIGTADTLELLKLPAIGPAFARRISNYRDKLGGFYSVNQLKEVWGLTDSIFQIISPHVVLRDSANIRKININTADYKEFHFHPYIDKSVANVLVNYRNQHGAFHTIEDIKNVPLFTAELYSKLAPYLKIE